MTQPPLPPFTWRLLLADLVTVTCGLGFVLVLGFSLDWLLPR
jgi:hypothetical protein